MKGEQPVPVALTGPRPEWFKDDDPESWARLRREISDAYASMLGAKGGASRSAKKRKATRRNAAIAREALRIQRAKANKKKDFK